MLLFSLGKNVAMATSVGGEIVQKTIEKWFNFAELDEELKEELIKLKQNEAELEDAFYENLSFGTGGIRGKLGPGPNRMNLYTVRKTTEGLANYIKNHTVNYESRGVVVAYDSRHKSEQFAYEVAKVLGAHNIKTYIFETIQPTPLLSFAVRHLRTVAGMMITASHNPPEYNGLKVYNEEGSQITSEEAEAIIASIEEVEDELTVRTKSLSYVKQNDLLEILKDEIGAAYLERMVPISSFTNTHTPTNIYNKEEKQLRIVFTPLHGTATELVTEGLRQLNFPNVYVVESQAVPDPEFSTVESPNPEDPRSFQKAIELGKEVDADLLLATDPDADRLGVAVRNRAGEYVTLNGNELGALLLDYVASHTDERILPSARMIKTIVTSELGRGIASSYGVKTLDTLTGFKYIGEKINEFDTTGETFLFGYEESYGYLMSPFVRDKDGVHAAMMTCEMAAFWQEKGLTLLDALEKLYERHGYYKEGVDDLTLEGKQGVEQILAIVDRFRNETITQFGSLQALYKEDYLNSERIDLEHPANVERLHLPRENVVKYILEANCWVCLRPSGTEPKIKWYYGAYGKTKEEVEARYTMLKETLHDLIVKEKVYK